MTLPRPWGLYQLERELKKMKKVLLVTASLIALGAAAPAVAADLAAAPDIPRQSESNQVGALESH